MILNCDIGERGPDHPVDRELMKTIGLANLACGGHAGDEESVAVFRSLAGRWGVDLSAHLSYPDPVHFGRVSMDLTWEELSTALECQRSMMPDVNQVKFHGALYNDSVSNPALATQLAHWLVDHSVQKILCPPGSQMAIAASALGIQVVAEAFVERRYQVSENGVFTLMPRSDPRSVILDLSAAVAQARALIERGFVRTPEGLEHRLGADTLCIHSDSPIALELARAVSKLMEGRA